MEVDGEPSWFAKEILHFTTIFIVNMDTQWNIWNLDEIVNGLGMALVNCEMVKVISEIWDAHAEPAGWCHRNHSSGTGRVAEDCRDIRGVSFTANSSPTDMDKMTEIIELKSMIWFGWCTDMHWYMFQGAKWIKWLSIYLLHRFAILCKAFMLVNSKETSHAVATDVVDWALQQKIINLDQRRNAVRAQNDVDIRGLRRWVVWFVWRVLQMTSSTLAFLGPGTACSRRLHREQVLDTEHAKLVLDRLGQTISPHPISL